MEEDNKGKFIQYPKKSFVPLTEEQVKQMKERMVVLTENLKLQGLWDEGAW